MPINTVAPKDIPKASPIKGEVFCDSHSLDQIETANATGSIQRNKKAQQEEHTNYKHFADISMFKAMEPFFFSMKLMGLFHERNFSKGRQVSISLLYSIFVIVLLWVLVCQNGFVFNHNDSFGPMLFIKFMILIWQLQCGFNSITCFNACFYYHHLPEFFVQWSLIRHPSTHCIKYVRIKTIIYTGTCWVVALVNTSFIGYGIFCTNLFNTVIKPMEPSHPYVNIYRGILMIAVVYSTTIWVFPVALTMLICSVIDKEFQLFNNELTACVSRVTSAAELDVETYRQRYQRLCHLVVHGNNVLSLKLATSYLAGVTNVIFILYIVLYYPIIIDDSLSLVIHIVWCISNLILLILEAAGPAHINTSVSILSNLFQIVTTHKLLTCINSYI